MDTFPTPIRFQVQTNEAGEWATRFEFDNGAVLIAQTEEGMTPVFDNWVEIWPEGGDGVKPQVTWPGGPPR